MSAEGAKKTHTWEVQHSSSRSSWKTPPPLFRALNHEFWFEVDAAACADSRLCPDYYGPDHENERRRDALSNGRWVKADGKVPSAVFVNPPYGRGLTDKWIMAAWHASRTAPVVALVMACTETVWWEKWAWRADEIRFIKRRVRFVDPSTGATSGSAPKGSALIVFRPHVPICGWIQGPRVSLWGWSHHTP
jgi:phage N-6-adenine-methyltransferase